MAFRIKAAACLSIGLAAALCAQDLQFRVRHKHLAKGGEGMLTFKSGGVSFEETGKADHARQWKYTDFERLELAPNRIRVVTYEDARWQLGRDREYIFDRLEPDAAGRLYPFLAAHLDQRFIARVADRSISPLWTMPAKALRGRSGAQGMLKIGSDRIVFEAASAYDSRTWRFSDIQFVARQGTLDFAVVSLDGETRFQLKEAMPEDRYNSIWRRVAESGGLKTFHSSMEISHD
ncbi:MAG TPA: hypothetical protein VFA28_06970 [Bryobacteraceae bacterium]|jgi:hypothetical protein|nr:hypothetical protein [Bryobacteraceae bacterium]